MATRASVVLALALALALCVLGGPLTLVAATKEVEVEAEGGEGADSDVLVLTDASGNAVLKEHDEAGILVEFYAPWCGHCKKLAPTYELVATALKGEVAVAKVDATQHRSAMSQFGVKGFPTVVLVKGGKRYTFSGRRTLEDLTEFARTGDESGDGVALGGGAEPEYDGPDHVVVLDDTNFEELTQSATGATTGDWLVMFYAPWCGHCKKLHPTFKAVAAELKGKVNVASVDATVSLATARRFFVRGYPTVKMLSAGKEYTYSGKRTKQDMVEWATGGFADGDGQLIVAPATGVDAVMEELSAQWTTLKKDLSTLMRFKKNALIVTFAGGAVGGVLLAFVLFACLGGLSPPVLVLDSNGQQVTGQAAVDAVAAANAKAEANEAAADKPKND